MSQRWMESSAIRTGRGLTWPANPEDPKSIGHTLYSGSPGVVLFMIEMHRATKEDRYLDQAQAGADHLLSVIDTEKETGLYTGLAGIGFTLIETANATRDVKYRDGAKRAAERIRTLARPAGRGVEWNDTTDIIGGSAGTGLFLLYAAKELEQPAYRELAVKAARRPRRFRCGEAWASLRRVGGQGCGCRDARRRMGTRYGGSRCAVCRSEASRSQRARLGLAV